MKRYAWSLILIVTSLNNIKVNTQANPWVTVTLPVYRPPELIYPYAYQKLSPVSMSYDMGMDRSMGYARWFKSTDILQS